MRQRMIPVNVMTDTNGNPSKLKGPRKPVHVRRIIDAWRYGGRWWLSEPPRDYYLLELDSGHVVEVFRADERWVLSRVAD
jgi:hypothetical protein